MILQYTHTQAQLKKQLTLVLLLLLCGCIGFRDEQNSKKKRKEAKEKGKAKVGTGQIKLARGSNNNKSSSAAAEATATTTNCKFVGHALELAMLFLSHPSSLLPAFPFQSVNRLSAFCFVFFGEINSRSIGKCRHVNNINKRKRDFAIKLNLSMDNFAINSLLFTLCR